MWCIMEHWTAAGHLFFYSVLCTLACTRKQGLLRSMIHREYCCIMLYGCSRFIRFSCRLIIDLCRDAFFACKSCKLPGSWLRFYVLFGHKNLERISHFLFSSHPTSMQQQHSVALSSRAAHASSYHT